MKMGGAWNADHTGLFALKLWSLDSQPEFSITLMSVTPETGDGKSEQWFTITSQSWGWAGLGRQFPGLAHLTWWQSDRVTRRHARLDDWGWAYSTWPQLRAASGCLGFLNCDPKGVYPKREQVEGVPWFMTQPQGHTVLLLLLFVVQIITKASPGFRGGNIDSASWGRVGRSRRSTWDP